MQILKFFKSAKQLVTCNFFLKKYFELELTKRSGRVAGNVKHEKKETHVK